MPLTMADQDLIAVLPKAWRSAICQFAIERTDRGMGGANVFRLHDPGGTELYLKVVAGTAVSELRREIERTTWLEKHGVRVPEIIRVHEGSSFGACLMTPVPGCHPQEVLGRRSQVMLDLANGLRSLHSMPTANCPFDESIGARLTRAGEMIKAGVINPECFADRNKGLSPETIYDRLVHSIPEHESVVVVHGDATFDNLLVDETGRVGFVDCGYAGRGDRYLDLSTLVMEIDEHFGWEAKHLFVSSYGIGDLDTRKSEFFNDLYELF
jgi:aminoglycoside 3'-phosphotransferase II